MPTRDIEPAADASSVELKLAALADQVLRLEGRVALLEGLAPQARPAVAEPAPAAAGPQAPPARASAAAVLGLLGRTSLVLAGAFLIRTFTENGLLPHLGGVMLGLAYAAAWAWAADRAGVRGRPLSASYHAVAGAVIAYPLLWETTTRFQALAPAASAAVLLGFTALLLAVAWRHKLEGITWMATLASLGTGFALMAATSAIPVYCALFLLFAGATLLLRGRPQWQGLHWPVALGADGAILSMVVLAAAPGKTAELARSLGAPAALALALALAVVYLASFIARALVVPRSVRAFEAVQTLLVLAIGFGGALRVAGSSGTGTGALGLAGVLIGLGCYGAAFTFVRRQTEGSSDFRFLTSLGAVLVLGSSPFLLPDGWLALHFALLGLAFTALGRRFGRKSLLVHGAALLTGAALASGLLAFTARAFLAPGPTPLPWSAPVALAALLAGHGILLARRGPGPDPWGMRLPCLATGALALLGLAALALAALAPAADPGTLAALRTAVLALAAVAAGALGRWMPAGEQGWMVHPLLAATAVKLLLQDVPAGRPLTLTLALACFGLALLAAPRLARRNFRQAGADSAEMDRQDPP